MSTASSISGSIFHFHQSPRCRPTPYAESSCFSMMPSTCRSRDPARSAVSASHDPGRSVSEIRSGESARGTPPKSNKSSVSQTAPAAAASGRCAAACNSFSRKVRRSRSGRARRSSPAFSRRSYATNTTGNADRIRALTILRPSRRCRLAKGCGASPCHAMISPSSTVPSASVLPASAISGKLSVTISSPRDQINTSPRRRITCARMPSHFHSACHSATSPSAAGSPSNCEARKNG